MPEINATENFVIVEIISQRDQERAKLEEATKKSGLLIPPPKDDPSKQYGPPVMGIVYSIGKNGAEKWGDNIRIGDTVIYDEKNPKGFEFNGKRLLAVPIDKVVARLEREND